MKVASDLENFKLPTGNYGFSGTRIKDLGATEYTLVTLAVDESGSVSHFSDDLVACIKEIVNSCKLSPRADNLLIRLVTFDSHLTERHGYKMLSECNLDDYNGAIKTNGGMTALYDASVNAIDSAISYGGNLTKNDFAVNSIVFIITDGLDNQSSYTKLSVRAALEKSVKSESVESMISVLIGVNLEDEAKVELPLFHAEVKFTQYIDIGDASSKNLARLAQFVSKSVSSQSQSLGTGGPSKSLTF